MSQIQTEVVLYSSYCYVAWPGAGWCNVCLSICASRPPAVDRSSGRRLCLAIQLLSSGTKGHGTLIGHKAHLAMFQFNVRILPLLSSPLEPAAVVVVISLLFKSDLEMLV